MDGTKLISLRWLIFPGCHRQRGERGACTSAAPRRSTTASSISRNRPTGHATSWGSAIWLMRCATWTWKSGASSTPSTLIRVATGPFLSSPPTTAAAASPKRAHEAYHRHYTVPFFVRAPGIPARTDLYTLLANRANPGTNRTDYATQPQPIAIRRSNLALSLMGLPPIPDHSSCPFATPDISLRIAHFEGDSFWPDPSHALKVCDALAGHPMADHHRRDHRQRHHQVFAFTNATDVPVRYFRLKKQ